MSLGGTVQFVEAGSPADASGIRVGHVVTHVDGWVLHDIIDWRWHASGERIELSILDENAVSNTVCLERVPGQDWGIEFSDALFDGARTCVNNCSFCFMRQLPPTARPSLSIRDDDYRLSFLQGNFATFTNMTEDDISRVDSMRLSPLRFSLHAVSDDIRRTLMGPHAGRGIEVAEHLLSRGIELHAQIVLVPSVNDGEELERTLQWAWGHAGILTVGIVPVGFTRFQDRFTESYREPAAARCVIDAIEPFRNRALLLRGHAWVHPADEFYCNAYPDDIFTHLPPAREYGDFGMFEDGIGMVRSFVDDFGSCGAELADAASALKGASTRCLFVCGRAQEAFFPQLVEGSPLSGSVRVLPIENNYFGGNVNVTGLLSGTDVIRGIEQALTECDMRTFAVLTSAMFNHDGLTVDDMALSDIADHVSCPVHVVSCQPSDFLPELSRISRTMGGDQ